MKNIKNLIRIIITILALFLFFNIEIKFKKGVKPFGIYLIDGSNSMEGMEIPQIKTKYKLKKVIFNKKEEKTEIGNAILKYSREFPEASFIILFSDGNNNSGIEPVNIAKSINLPIYVISPKFKETPEITIKNYREFIRVIDTAYFYTKISKDGLLIIKEDGKTYLKMNLKANTEVKIPYFSEKEGENRLIFIFKSGDFSDTIEEKITFYPQKKYSIHYSKPNWNVRFIKRIIEDKGFKESEKGDINFFILEEKNENIEKKLRDFYKEKKSIFLIISYPNDINFIPFNKFTYKRDSIQDVYFQSSLPFYTIKNSKEMQIENTTVGYFSQNYQIFQSTIIELWKLSFTLNSLKNKDYLYMIIDSVLFFMGLKEKEVFIPDTVNSYQEFFIYTKGLNAKYVFIDSIFIPYTETILVYPLEEGVHRIKFVGRDTIIKDIYARNPYEKKGSINKLLLEEIVRVSGGKFIDREFNKEFDKKKIEIIYTPRHSIFIYLIIILLLSINWYLWMKER